MINLIMPYIKVKKKYYIEKLVLGEVHKYNSEKVNLNISGMYTTNIVKMLQSEIMVFSFIGGLYGKYIKNYLHKSKVKFGLIPTKSNTELQIVIADKENNKTVIKDKKMDVEDREYGLFINKISEWSKVANVNVINENFISNLDDKKYEEILRLLNKSNNKVIISLGYNNEDYEKLDSLIPYAIVVTKYINSNFKNQTMIEIINYYKEYVLKGIHYVVIDFGKRGCVIISKNKTCYIKPLEIKDEYKREWSEGVLGAFCVGIEKKYEQEKIGKLMVGTIISGYSYLNNGYISKNDILRNKKKTMVEEIL